MPYEAIEGLARPYKDLKNLVTMVFLAFLILSILKGHRTKTQKRNKVLLVRPDHALQGFIITFKKTL